MRKRSIVQPSSPRELRALAHPLRLRILGELRSSGPLTVGRLSDLFDEAPGSISYHLGVLVEFGYVEEVPELAADRRERWWRAAHEITQIAPGATSAGVRHQIVDVYAASLHRVIDAEPTTDPAWRSAATSSDVIAHLNADQLADASRELDALLEKWAEVGREATGDSCPVQLIGHAFLRP